MDGSNKGNAPVKRSFPVCTRAPAHQISSHICFFCGTSFSQWTDYQRHIVHDHQMASLAYQLYMEEHSADKKKKEEEKEDGGKKKKARTETAVNNTVVPPPTASPPSPLPPSTHNHATRSQGLPPPKTTFPALPTGLGRCASLLQPPTHSHGTRSQGLPPSKPSLPALLARSLPSPSPLPPPTHSHATRSQGLPSVQPSHSVLPASRYPANKPRQSKKEKGMGEGKEEGRVDKRKSQTTKEEKKEGVKEDQKRQQKGNKKEKRKEETTNPPIEYTREESKEDEIEAREEGKESSIEDQEEKMRKVECPVCKEERIFRNGTDLMVHCIGTHDAFVREIDIVPFIGDNMLPTVTYDFTPVCQYCDEKTDTLTKAFAHSIEYHKAHAMKENEWTSLTYVIKWSVADHRETIITQIKLKVMPNK